MGTHITKEQAIDLVNRGLLPPDVLDAYNSPQSWSSVETVQKEERSSYHRGGYGKRGGRTTSDEPVTAKKNKYNNHKLYEYEDGAISRNKDETSHGSVIDIFDSEKEYKRWKMLQMLERAGGIENLEKQKRFTLQDAFEREGKKVRPITYIADFYYFNKKDNIWVVEDVKGAKATQTKDFNLKKKMFWFRYPEIRFVIVEN